jgi:hypothetical protein
MFCVARHHCGVAVVDILIGDCKTGITVAENILFVGVLIG